MRILIVSDIHGATRAIAGIVEELAEIDLILIAGDITDFGGERAAAAILDPLARAGKPIAAVSGNCDRDGVRTLLTRGGFSIEGRGKILCGLRLVGAGGGLYKQGLTPFEATEDELEDSIRAALASGEERDTPLVIMTHTPPGGTSLDRLGTNHVGSLALSAALSEFSPLLWISGHIHESRSISTKGRTTLINPGPLYEGFYAVASVNESEDRKMVTAELRSLKKTR